MKNEVNLMQQALGDQWYALPAALQAHYQAERNTDVGQLRISYPRWLQVFYNLLHWIGALINRRGESVSATVEKYMDGPIQYWTRRICFADGKCVLFKSRWQLAGKGELIEYVNAIMGLRMAVRVEQGRLYYEGRCFVFRLGRWFVQVPEGLLLGHTTIVEQAISDEEFEMDFRLRHPLLGQVYAYAGRFSTRRGMISERGRADTELS